MGLAMMQPQMPEYGILTQDEWSNKWASSNNPYGELMSRSSGQYGKYAQQQEAKKKSLEKFLGIGAFDPEKKKAQQEALRKQRQTTAEQRQIERENAGRAARGGGTATIGSLVPSSRPVLLGA